VRAGMFLVLSTLAGVGEMAGQMAGPVIMTPAGRTETTVDWKKAINAATDAAPDARVVVLDIASGRLLGSAHLAEASLTLATPGSTLKPLILYYALAGQVWDPERRVACRRKLHIGKHELDCSHPAMLPMDAVQALAWSCNSYFAELAGTLRPEDLRGAFSARGLLASTGLGQVESVAEFREPTTKPQTRLAALGVEGITVTLPELAEAYRSLAQELAAYPQRKAARTVMAGMTDSASFGMAEGAGLGGVSVAGKTGTASPEAGGRTHGWFVGLAPAGNPRVVVAVYLPAGRGSDAARVAGKVLAGSPLRVQ